MNDNLGFKRFGKKGSLSELNYLQDYAGILTIFSLGGLKTGMTRRQDFYCIFQECVFPVLKYRLAIWIHFIQLLMTRKYWISKDSWNL